MPRTIIHTSTLQHNRELAAIFHRMSDFYRYLGNAERFRAIAYDTASKTLSNIQEPVDVYGDDIKKLDELKGVGESIAEKIIEYLRTGKIKTFERLKTQVPQKLLELMDVEGIGPATVRLLHDELTINSKEELIDAIEKRRLETIKGFGTKKIENIRRVLKLNVDKKRMRLKEAQQIGDIILNVIKNIPGVNKCTLAGSLRRKKETVGDIDIVVTAERKKWKSIINRFIHSPLIARVLASGETKASVLLKENNVQVDVRIVHDYEYGAALFYFTGSKEHNVKLRLMAKERGWKLNEYGVFDIKSGKRLAGETEEEIYNLFGLPFIPSEQRTESSELK